MNLRSQGGPALLDWAYLLLVLALIEASVLGFVLVLLPLALSYRRRSRPVARRRSVLAITVYFLCLGLGFLLVEIVFLQKLSVVLAHPVMGFAIVVGSFLVFAGLGSGSSRAWTDWWQRRHQLESEPGGIAIRPLALVLGGLIVAYALTLRPILHVGLSWPLGFRILLSVALIAPLAFLMGMPFPLGLSSLARRRRAWIPWAWGINGWASVMAAVLAHLLAIHIGFSALLLCAAGLYLIAGMVAHAVG